MKANEMPERIYIFDYNDAIVTPLEGDTTYVREDAFIEKATLWLLTNASDYCILHNSYDTKELVKDFVDAMKRD
jgi:hypothetical protein